MIAAPEGSDIAAQLYDLGIRPKEYREGTPLRSRCPKCDGGNDHEDSLTVTIDQNRQGAVWICHRGKCGWSDNLLVSKPQVLPFRRSKPYRKPEPVAPDDQHISQALYDWFAERSISRETVNTFGCYLTRRWFHAKGEHPEGIHPAIAFPYVYNGQIVNRKFRSRHKQIAQEPDAMPTLFNVDSLREDGYAVFVEGETDTMAVHEAGWLQVVSLKDGAPPPKGEVEGGETEKRPKDELRYQALEIHADRLERIQKFYLAGDADGPGKQLMEELARRLGRHRCWIVTWPFDCKDACDVSRLHGPEVVSECINNAKPYPIDGVQEVTGEALVDFRAQHTPPILSTGLAALDQILRLPGEGRLIILTGVPNAGKSPFVTNLMVHLMLREDRRFLVFSPEMQPWQDYALLCAQVLYGKPARKHRGWLEGDPLLTDDEIIAAGDWLQGRLHFLSSDAVEEAPTLEWILDRGQQSALKLGITDLLIDPWNEVEHQRGGQSETDYTGRALQKCKGFGYRHGANVWIAVHPTKMRSVNPGEPPPPPGPYDINGSANFANKADLGLTVHRQEDCSKIMLWKSKFYRWGTKSTAAELHYSPITGRYASLDGRYGPDAWDTPL